MSILITMFLQSTHVMLTMYLLVEGQAYTSSLMGS